MNTELESYQSSADPIVVNFDTSIKQANEAPNLVLKSKTLKELNTFQCGKYSKH